MTPYIPIPNLTDRQRFEILEHCYSRLKPLQHSELIANLIWAYNKVIGRELDERQAEQLFVYYGNHKGVVNDRGMWGKGVLT